VAGLTDRFIRILRYPLEAASPDGRTVFVFDGRKVLFQEEKGTLICRMDLGKLPEDKEKRQEKLSRLMFYAMGRSIREEAVLAFDGRDGCLVLWRKMKDEEEDGNLIAQLENFLANADWWLARLNNDEGNAPKDNPFSIQAMFIRP